MEIGVEARAESLVAGMIVKIRREEGREAKRDRKEMEGLVYIEVLGGGLVMIRMFSRVGAEVLEGMRSQGSGFDYILGKGSGEAEQAMD